MTNFSAKIGVPPSVFYSFYRFAFVAVVASLSLLLPLSASAQTAPSESDCVQKGGRRLCVPPLVGEWKYTHQRCDAPVPANDEESANVEGAARYYGGCGGDQIIEDRGTWGTQQMPTGGACGSLNTYPQFNLGVEGINVKGVLVRYCRADGIGSLERFNVNRQRPITCPDDYEPLEYPNNEGYCAPRRSPKCSTCDESTTENSVGNPIDLGSGNKKQVDTDYSASNSMLSFTRTYLSQLDSASGRMGRKWTHNFDKRLFTVAANPNVAFNYRGDGTIYTYWKANGVWTTDPDGKDRIAPITNASNVVTGWKLTASDDTVEQYSVSGLLTSRIYRNGLSLNFTYSDSSTPTSIAPYADLLITVTDSFGRTLSLIYDTKGRITTMRDSAAQSYTYAYDADNNLKSVTYPSGASRTYFYNEPSQMSGLFRPTNLTGIQDEKGVRFATFGYDVEGNARSTEHAGGVNKYTTNRIPYPPTFTDPLGTAREFVFGISYGVPKLVYLAEPCLSAGCTTANVLRRKSFDANGNLSTVDDFNGNRIAYTYDLTRNLELVRTGGLAIGPSLNNVNTTATRKTVTTWHPTYRIPTSIVEKSVSLSGVETNLRETTFTHDTNGNVLTRSVKDSALNITRTSTYTYDTYGRVLTSKDPRNNVTTNTYYPNTVAQNSVLPNSRGMLASVTNALGHVTNYTSYDANGRVLTMTDANGLVTAMTYHPRGWLLSRTVGAGLTGGAAGSPETTTYDYDGVGQLIKVTLPTVAGSAAAFMTYTYDGAHRLVGLQDSEGARITYTLDNMGNRIAENAFDPANTLARSRTRVYDALNRLKQDIGATFHTTDPARQITQYSYDNQGNLTTTTDPLNHSNTNSYDALNRLITATDPNNGQSQYTYNALDQLTNVKDAKNLNTTYTYNAFGEVLTQLSPDTGTTSFTYDAAGNMLLKTDARGSTAKYTYDALNRVTQTKFYPTLANANANTSSDETRTYTYDTGCPITATGSTANTKGRLCTLADKAGTTSFSYDLKGRITAKSQTVSSLTQSHSYRYNAAGQMDQWTTASGQIIGYTYAHNKISGMTVNGTALISNVLYDPFGPPVGWLWPSATTPNLKTYRDYDLDGRLTRWELKNGTSYIQRDVVWDDANRVTQLKDLLTTTAANPNNPQTFAYDNLDRLTTTNLGTATTASQALTYDAIGNRTSATINGILSTYNYPSPVVSHRLTSTTGGTNPRTFTYDAMGNLTNDGKYTYTYWHNGRINTVTWLTGTAPNTTTNTATYNINALGQRVRKVTPTAIVGTRRFMYDEAGHLTGEYDSAGKLIQETVWFGDLPIATLRPKSGSATTPIAIDIFYVHADHLGTPRVITRPSDNKVVWEWRNDEPFGNNLPNENPSAFGTFTYNLRLGGWQQYDKETGTLYNHFRDYSAPEGRYIQSDPIGLAGGVNTYLYSGAEPLKYSDRFGLDRWYDPAWGGGAGENWWWNCPPNPHNRTMIRGRPVVTIPWFGSGPPPPFDKINNNACLYRPPRRDESCELVATLVCTGISAGSGVGLPWSPVISQGCQVVLKPTCKNKVCEWPQPNESPFGYGP
jgi:RHS repeat-associated protein